VADDTGVGEPVAPGRSPGDDAPFGLDVHAVRANPSSTPPYAEILWTPLIHRGYPAELAVPWRRGARREEVPTKAARGWGFRVRRVGRSHKPPVGGISGTVGPWEVA
jgi:hypothetical protein